MRLARLWIGFAALAALLMVLPAGVLPAWAQIYVIESSAPEIKVGAQLAMADTLLLPAGAMIRAVLPSGKTQTIKGPYRGRVADLARGQEINEGVVGWLKNILQTGGATEATPGATRSARPPARPRAAGRFSWTDVPTSTDGNVCVGKDGKLQLARAPAAGAQRVAVVEVESAARGEAEWPVGQELAAWPAQVTVRPGGTYWLLIEGRPRRQLQLEVFDQLPGEDDVLAALHKRGCLYQFEAFVRDKLAGAKP
jgi:hypothetical protein